ncbi:hypothetical protein O181_078485 [Austropuccinia psidii MF-1]|uniref:Tet-like 2OG-Fe(II) oxygenase domain-containing protein n=1 Tax=Austropuccinia psidii MF-1 TaxID=1389203 RepID=A0A9Q3FCX7_9BASI|nr:hypothetical protein [Austropuccinia psidii MF-1]
MGRHSCGALIGPHGGTLALDPKGLASNDSPQYLISCLLQHQVIPQPPLNGSTSQKRNRARTTQRNKFFSSSKPMAQISMPVSENIDASEIWRIVDFTQTKLIHFGCVAIFSFTISLISLVEFRPLAKMAEVEVNQLDKLSHVFFCKRNFTDTIPTNGALIKVAMLYSGWHKFSMKNAQFDIYRSLGKIVDTKEEWQNEGENMSSVGCISGQSLLYFGDKFFKKIQTHKNSLGVLSFDQINYDFNISTNQGEFKFALALNFTMNRFKYSPNVEKD